MEREDFLKILTSDNYSRTPSNNNDNNTEEEREVALAKKHEQKKGSENPYSNDKLASIIDGMGYDVDEVVDFSSIAKKLAGHIAHEDTQKDLTSMDNHDTIKDVSPAQKSDSLEMKREALKRLIAKYKE